MLAVDLDKTLTHPVSDLAEIDWGSVAHGRGGRKESGASHGLHRSGHFQLPVLVLMRRQPLARLTVR